MNRRSFVKRLGLMFGGLSILPVLGKADEPHKGGFTPRIVSSTEGDFRDIEINGFDTKGNEAREVMRITGDGKVCITRNSYHQAGLKVKTRMDSTEKMAET